MDKRNDPAFMERYSRYRAYRDKNPVSGASEAAGQILHEERLRDIMTAINTTLPTAKINQSPHGGFHSEATNMWSGYLAAYRPGLQGRSALAPLPYDPFQRLGVNSWEDFVELYVEYFREHAVEYDPESHGTYPIIKFKDFVLDKLTDSDPSIAEKIDDLEKDEKDPISFMEWLWYGGSGSPETHVYRRLEREHAVYTARAEEYLLEILNRVISHWKENRFRDEPGLGEFNTKDEPFDQCFIQSILWTTDAYPMITSDEFIDIISKERTKKGIYLLIRKGRLAQGYYDSNPEEICRQLGYRGHTTTSTIILEDGSTKQHPINNFDIGGLSFPLHDFFKSLSIRDFEKRLKDKKELYDGKIKDAESRKDWAERGKLEEYSTPERFALHLINLWRRRRGSLE